MNRKFLTILTTAAFLLCYGGVVVMLLQMWATRPVYSYGFVLPLVSGYIVWSQRERLRSIPQEPDYLLGVTVTLVALALLMVGHIGSIIALKSVSIVVAIAGVILLRSGRAVLARVWFPLAYLLLGMPIWDGVIARLQEPSQLLSGSIATAMLHAVGIPALHDGINITIPVVTLEVMRECSGVNQLMTIVAMTLPTAYLMLKGSLRRILLVAMGVVISYVSNGARIALVGILAQRGLGDGNLRGVHLLEGLAVSLLGYVLLFACFTALSNSPRAGSDESEQPVSAARDSQSLGRPPSQPSWIEAGTVAAMLLSGAFLLAYRPAEIALRRNLDAFPTRIGEWVVDTMPDSFGNRFPGIDDALLRAYPTPTGERRFARGDDELTRVYRDTAGNRVRLFVAYHRSQHEGKELAGETSALLANIAVPVSLAGVASTVAVNEVTQESAAKQRTVLYWYVLNGRIVSDMRRAKIYMIWDALAHRRTNGAVVMLGWESAPGGQSVNIRRRALELAQAVCPLLNEYLPSSDAADGL